MSRARIRRRSTRGTASVELAILVPGLVMLLGLMMAGGRVWMARTSVNEAAFSAARSASLQRSAGAAATSAAAAGHRALQTGGLGCVGRTVQVDLAAFAVPVGQPATISSTVTCTVTFSDLLLPGMPGSLQLTGHGSSALDTYRERS